MYNSKKAIIIIMSILIFSVGIALFFFKKDSSIVKPEENNQQKESLSFSSRDNEMIESRDFLKDIDNKHMPYDNGVLTELGSYDDFSISYNSNPEQFTIQLANIPLKDVREKAEKELLRRTGIMQEKFCKLDVVVLVPKVIDEELSGIDLGLSFCPGSMKL